MVGHDGPGRIRATALAARRGPAKLALHDLQNSGSRPVRGPHLHRPPGDAGATPGLGSPALSNPDRRLVCGLGALALVSLLLLVHNYGLSLLPEREVAVDPAAITALQPGVTPAYAFAFDADMPDLPLNPRSRVRLFENGRPLERKTMLGPLMLALRNGRWAHAPGYILFSTPDNSDPRRNHRRYTLSYPPWRSSWLGPLAGVLFVLSVTGLYGLGRGQPAVSPAARPTLSHWRWHVAAAGLLFAVGLYCNTGTLAPYGNTYLPQVDPATGYLFNIDHGEFKALFAFVDGAPRAAWAETQMLRRILFPVMAWPFMKAAGFELGGWLASLLLQLAGWAGAVWWLSRRHGRRAAVAGAWLLALYPGAAYWSGLPYAYVAIFPGSLALLIGVQELVASPSWRRSFGLALLIGLGFLAYDLAPFFLPATFFAFALQRRWRPACGWPLVQAVPLGLWLLVLRFGFQVGLGNDNASIYRNILTAYVSPAAWHGWLATVSEVPTILWQVWFGSNFVFLPGVFLAVLAVNAWTGRVRLTVAETGLLLAGALLFLFNNLAPAYDGWSIRGAWIARIYQPVFPVMIFFVARWFGQLPPLSRPARWVGGGIGLGAALGCLLIIFGPILDNPGRISENAFLGMHLIPLSPWGSVPPHGRLPADGNGIS